MKLTRQSAEGSGVRWNEAQDVTGDGGLPPR